MLLAYLLVALLFTWPLPITPTVATLGSGSDGWQETWEMWWFNRALQTGTSPYHFTTLYAPFGATNYLHSLNPIEITLTLPVQGFFGPLLAYNVACWMALVLTAFAGYLLARDVTGSRPAAVAGGFALGFAPHQFAQLLGHMDVASIQFFVLCVWCIYRSFRASGREAILWILWGAISLAASALTHPYALICAILVGITLSLYHSIGNRSHWWQPIARGAATLALGVLVSSPLLIAMAQQRSGPDAPERRTITPEEIEFYSADLAAYITPSPFNPLWSSASQQAMAGIRGGASENVVFPGFSVLGLALVGALMPSTRRRAVFWWLLAVGGFILSLGPVLQIAGSSTGISLPAGLFYMIPGTDIVRVPARFNILVLMGLGVCAALGLHAIRLSQIRRAQKQLIYATGGLLIFIEFLPVPYPLAEFQVETWFKEAAPPAGNSSLLEVPFDRGDARPLEAQMVHGLPLVGGYLSKQPVYPLSSGIPPFTDLGLNRYSWLPPFERARDTICEPQPLEGTYADIMRLFDVRFLALHLDRLEAGDPRIRMIGSILGTNPIYRSYTLLVYDTGGGEARQTLLGGVEDIEDWSGVEVAGPEKFRWATGRFARLYLWSGSERLVTLSFNLSSFMVKRNISVSINGTQVETAEVGEDPHPIVLNWRASKGLTTIMIEASGDGIKPSSVGIGDDTRPLTIRLSGCRYAPAP